MPLIISYAETFKYSFGKETKNTSLLSLLALVLVLVHENHFLFHCNKYSTGRDILFDACMRKNANFIELSVIEKLICIMRNNIFPLAKFILSSLDLRSEHMFSGSI